MTCKPQCAGHGIKCQHNFESYKESLRCPVCGCAKYNSITTDQVSLYLINDEPTEKMLRCGVNHKYACANCGAERS